MLDELNSIDLFLPHSISIQAEEVDGLEWNSTSTAS